MLNFRIFNRDFFKSGKKFVNFKLILTNLYILKLMFTVYSTLKDFICQFNVENFNVRLS